MSEKTKFGKARLLEERDVSDILNVLLAEEFYREYPNRVRSHLERLGRRGLDRYENNLVVERDGKAVGRLSMDTSYPPYAELSGLLVHPEYRGQGVGTELIEGFISMARQFDCSIMYLMAGKDNPAAHRFYRRFEFQPAMLKGFEDNEREICLFRFADTPCYREYMSKHPLSVYSVSGGKIDFHGNQAYEMKWKDPLTDDFLTFYLKGKRHESMPRIAGIARKENSTGFDAWTEEMTLEIGQGKSAELRMAFENTGKGKLELRTAFLLSKGTSVKEPPTEPISLEPKEKSSCRPELNVEEGFEVPVLSFWTVIVTCQLQLDKFSSVFPLSAGFEMDRPPMKRKE